MMGLLDRDKVREALTAQKTQKAAGQAQLVGEVMIGKGWLTPRQVAAILVAQKRYRAESQGQAAPAAAASKPAEGGSARPVRQKLGSFELIRKIGEGAMGQVFEAVSPTHSGTVALKVLPRDLAQDQEFVERFKREIKLMGALHHPHIVELYDAGVAAGYYYISMEFIDGEPLDKRLKREGKLAEKEALRIAREMAVGLAHAHGKGMIHRDIKPDNVLLAKSGAAKITDFGLAKPAEDKQHLTAAGFSIGTPFYISPEQAIGKEKVDHRADLYGLGATLFHMLTGRVPFEHASSTQVMVMHVQNPPPDPRSVNPAVSRGASQVVLKLLAKQPEQRFGDGTELAAALQALIESEQPSGGDTQPVEYKAEEPRTRTKKLQEGTAEPAPPQPGGFFGWLRRLFGGR